MPQRLTHVEFSGMTIRDNKVPYIFLAGGDHGDDQEPVGRTIFTLALMTVLVARRIFALMTWDGGSAAPSIPRTPSTNTTAESSPSACCTPSMAAASRRASSAVRSA